MSQKSQPEGDLRNYPERSRTVLHQTVLFTKRDGIGLECSLILPCQWVLEFGGEVQDIEGTFRPGPGTALLLYDDILLDVPLLLENERSTSRKVMGKRRTGTERSEDMLGGRWGDRRGECGS